MILSENQIKIIKKSIISYFKIENNKSINKPTLFRYPHHINISEDNLNNLQNKDVYICKIYAYTHSNTGKKS